MERSGKREGLLEKALGIPGITRTKSTINSELECVITAKLAYVPCATSSFSSICN